MAQNIINLSPESGKMLVVLKNIYGLNGLEYSSNSVAINAIIATLYEGIISADEETSIALFNLKKSF